MRNITNSRLRLYCSRSVLLLVARVLLLKKHWAVILRGEKNMTSPQWIKWWLDDVRQQTINLLRPRLNRCPFTDDIFKCIFLNENEWISPRISLKFVSEVRINNIPALVQIMAWRRSGGKPLSEPMVVSLLTHICITRPQWVNLSNVYPDQWCHMLPLDQIGLFMAIYKCSVEKSHFLNQCWPKSLVLYSMTGPQRVNF